MFIKRKSIFYLATAFVLLLIAGALLATMISRSGNKIISQVEQKEKFTEADVLELSNVFLKIDTANNILLEGSYELYDVVTNQLLEEEPFILAKYNGNTYSLIGSLEQFVKSNTLVMIDNEHKVIAVQDSSLTEDASFSILDGFMEMKKVMNNSTDLDVSITSNGKFKVVQFKGDSSGVFKTSEIVYDPETGKLKSSSVINSIIAPDNNENGEKKVLLKMVIKQYETNPSNNKHQTLNNKIRLNSNKKIQIDDSLKQYQIHYN